MLCDVAASSATVAAPICGLEFGRAHRYEASDASLRLTATSVKMEYIMTSFVPPEPLPVLYAENQSEARARNFHEQARKDAAWRATLHPTAPLLAVHFHGQGRLAALVLGPAGGATTAGADIGLCSVSRRSAPRARGAPPSSAPHN